MSADLVGASNGFFGEGTANFVTFEGIIQTGTHVDDDPAMPLASPMPWQHLRDLTVEDLEAMFTYLDVVQSEQPSELTTDKATQDASYYCTDNTMCDSDETCDTTAHECIGRLCGSDSDCRVCQTCTTGSCTDTLIANCSDGL